jgi:hypothetical protein
MSPGDVVYIWLEPSHLGGAEGDFKFCISVDTKEKRFLIVNSETRRLTPEQNVPISVMEAPFLHHDSFIDVSRLIGLTYGEFKNGMTKQRGSRKACECGTLNPIIIRRLLPKVAASKTLPQWQIKRVIENLSVLLKTQNP